MITKDPMPSFTSMLMEKDSRVLEMQELRQEVFFLKKVLWEIVEKDLISQRALEQVLQTIMGHKVG